MLLVIATIGLVSLAVAPLAFPTVRLRLQCQLALDRGQLDDAARLYVELARRAGSEDHALLRDLATVIVLRELMDHRMRGRGRDRDRVWGVADFELTDSLEVLAVRPADVERAARASRYRWLHRSQRYPYPALTALVEAGDGSAVRAWLAEGYANSRRGPPPPETDRIRARRSLRRWLVRPHFGGLSGVAYDRVAGNPLVWQRAVTVLAGPEANPDDVLLFIALCERNEHALGSLSEMVKPLRREPWARAILVPFLRRVAAEAEQPRSSPGTWRIWDGLDATVELAHFGDEPARQTLKAFLSGEPCPLRPDPSARLPFGAWREAAVALAELGDPTGIEALSRYVVRHHETGSREVLQVARDLALCRPERPEVLDAARLGVAADSAAAGGDQPNQWVWFIGAAGDESDLDLLHDVFAGGRPPAERKIAAVAALQILDRMKRASSE